MNLASFKNYYLNLLLNFRTSDKRELIEQRRTVLVSKLLPHLLYLKNRCWYAANMYESSYCWSKYAYFLEDVLRTML